MTLPQRRISCTVAALQVGTNAALRLCCGVTQVATHRTWKSTEVIISRDPHVVFIDHLY